MSDKKPTPLSEVREAIAKRQAQAKAEFDAIPDKSLMQPPTVGGSRPPKKRGGSPRQREERLRAKGRLPDGTTQSQTWLAGRGVWVLEMIVPVGLSESGEPQVAKFHHTSPNLFPGLEELDDKWREYLKTGGGR